MAENTPVSRKFLGNTTEELAALHGKERQLVIDTTKNTAVVMDGVTPGGHPLAKESVKIKSGSPNVKINDGENSDLSGDVTLSVGEKTWGRVIDGPIDFDDDEQVAEAADGLAIGATVSFDCCSDPDCPTGDDPIYINGIYNTKVYITESGEYTCPVTGWCKVTCIGGGAGGQVEYLSNSEGKITKASITGGPSGAYASGIIYLEKGEKVSVTIGSGGIGRIIVLNTANPDMRQGGRTIFKSVVANGGFHSFSSEEKFTETIRGLRGIWITSSLDGYNYGLQAFGGGFGAAPDYGDNSAQENSSGIYYGAGGNARCTADGHKSVGNGAPGCVILQYYDAAKDKNISIDMASSITLKELQSQLAALDARVQELENGQQ